MSPRTRPRHGERAFDLQQLERAIALAHRCESSPVAFSVGAIVVDSQGQTLGTGFSREEDPRDHAEEVALARAASSGGLPATLYSSLEPCGRRLSRGTTCVDRILAAGVQRVVYALREPPFFVPGGGRFQLVQGGVVAVEVPELAPFAREPNLHLWLARGLAANRALER